MSVQISQFSSLKGFFGNNPSWAQKRKTSYKTDELPGGDKKTLYWRVFKPKASLF
jgi:hypothetical protein